jgi:hypothetical protein
MELTRPLSDFQTKKPCKFRRGFLFGLHGPARSRRSIADFALKVTLVENVAGRQHALLFAVHRIEFRRHEFHEFLLSDRAGAFDVHARRQRKGVTVDGGGGGARNLFFGCGGRCGDAGADQRGDGNEIFAFY